MGAWSHTGINFKKQTLPLLAERWNVKIKGVLAYTPSLEWGSLYTCLLNSALSLAPPFFLLYFCGLQRQGPQSWEAFSLLFPHAGKIKELIFSYFVFLSASDTDP